MSLLTMAYVPVVLMEKVRVSDGEGGFIAEWQEGVRFQAAITFDTSIQGRIAEKQGVTSRYTITTNKSAKLEFHDVIKRLKDGKIFRLTSDSEDLETPEVASLQICQATAEEWNI